MELQLSAEALSIPLRVGQTTLDNAGMKPFVRKGDTVLFRYMVVMQWQQLDAANIHDNQHLIDGKMYRKVDYSMVLGVVRDGQLIPAPGYIFAKSIEKHNGDK